MATQKTINITGDWQSLNALSGAAVGDPIDVQVSRGRGVKVATYSIMPDSSIQGFQFDVGKFFKSEAGALECWVRTSIDGDLGQLEVSF